MNLKHKSAFTLVEMVVTVAIISLLAIAIIPFIGSMIEKSYISRLLADVQSFETAAASFQADVGSFSNFNGEDQTPSNSHFVNNSPTLNNWEGPYLEGGRDIHSWGGVYHLFFVDIDNVTANLNLGFTEDLVVKLKKFDNEGEALEYDENDIENRVNKKLTGDSDPTNPKADVNNGEVRVVILSNVR